MAEVRAVVIDGVGNTKDIARDHEPLQLFWSIPRHVSTMYQRESQPVRKVDYPCATFVNIGTLPDGRVVYGQQEAKLQLWCFDIDVADEAQRSCYFDIAQHKLQEWLQTLGRPVACLYYMATRDSASYVEHHHFEGVGRKLGAIG